MEQEEPRADGERSTAISPTRADRPLPVALGSTAGNGAQLDCGPSDPAAPLANAPSAVERRGLFDRIGDLSRWSDPDKCIFVAAVCVSAALTQSVPWLFSLSEPRLESYIDPAALPLAIGFSIAMAAAWTLLALFSWWIRRRRARAPRLLAAAVALMTIHLLFITYIVGPLTHPFAGVTIIGCWAGGLVFLPKRQLTVALGVWWLGFLAMIAGGQLGLLPDAPLYRGGPIADGRLDPAWLLSSGAWILFFTAFVQLVIYAIIERWHARERSLAVTSRQLAQANDVISRYVASQLAEQIREGNHHALERHERRRLTLFFSDIQEFATIADLVEPEDLSRQLNEYLAEMTAIAERHGATIDKFVGDAIMIFFGAPAATGDRDQALRATRMAIEMQQRLAFLRRQWLRDGAERVFHVRMGINTGQASVGAFGSPSRLEYTAIGRQVNLAARLQAQCEPDRILLSHSTFTLVRDEIPCESKGEISVKGFHQPVKVYEVIPPEPRSER